jgi:hypothetical protein
VDRRTAFTKPVALPFSRRSRQAHGIVDHGGRRDPIEMLNLIEAEPQDDEYVPIKGLERSLGHALNQIVTGSLPAQCSMNDSGRERSIPLVRETASAFDQGRRQVSMVGCDRRQRTERSRARRGRHRPLN